MSENKRPTAVEALQKIFDHYMKNPLPGGDQADAGTDQAMSWLDKMPGSHFPNPGLEVLRTALRKEYPTATGWADELATRLVDSLEAAGYRIRPITPGDPLEKGLFPASHDKALDVKKEPVYAADGTHLYDRHTINMPMGLCNELVYRGQTFKMDLNGYTHIRERQVGNSLVGREVIVEGSKDGGSTWHSISGPMLDADGKPVMLAGYPVVYHAKQLAADQQKLREELEKVTQGPKNYGRIQPIKAGFFPQPLMTDREKQLLETQQKYIAGEITINEYRKFLGLPTLADPEGSRRRTDASPQKSVAEKVVKDDIKASFAHETAAAAFENDQTVLRAMACPDPVPPLPTSLVKVPNELLQYAGKPLVCAKCDTLIGHLREADPGFALLEGNEIKPMRDNFICKCRCGHKWIEKKKENDVGTSG